ncbi:uncharacterized protein RCO7_09903 [Rhynchosporium graminicola]|uniref:Uncharacterized protein n=1 Tax=Rhynchosporium graminicola TaxID=2792576 RepID=A0A1E1LKZ7_9HELO|nr:uncharacterized protein RCO7_09903 [Rhynchosporium commune]
MVFPSQVSQGTMIVRNLDGNTACIMFDQMFNCITERSGLGNDTRRRAESAEGESKRVLSQYRESIVDLTVIETKIEESESEGAESSSIPEFGSPLEQISQDLPPGTQSLTCRTRSAGFDHDPLMFATPDTCGLQDEEPSDQDVVPTIPRGQHCSGSNKLEIKLHSDGVVSNPLELLPIASTRKNHQLFQFFVQILSPFISSIDGENPHGAFRSQWLSFMMQSPIAAHVAIVSATHYQAVVSNVDVDNSVDATSSKGTLITLINEHISGPGNGVSDDSIAAVMSLASNEVINLPDIPERKLIYSVDIFRPKKHNGSHARSSRHGQHEGRTQQYQFWAASENDFEIASTYECEVLLDSIGENESNPSVGSFPLELSSPILHALISFVDTISILHINVETAKILDDARSMTIAALALSSSTSSLTLKEEVLMDIHNIIQRLASLPTGNPTSPGDFLYQACRMTAMIYSSAIINRTPLSMACTPEILQELWAIMWQVPSLRWKQVPGIFLWILLVIGPFSRDKSQGKYIKALTQAAIMAITLVDEDTVTVTLRRFLAVQRWLGGSFRDMDLPIRESYA